MKKMLKFAVNSAIVGLLLLIGYGFYASYRDSAVAGVLTFYDATTLFRGLFLFYMAIISLYIIIDNKRANKAISWLLMMIAFPVAGFLLYMMFGRSFRKEKLALAKKHYMSKRLGNRANAQLKFIKNIGRFADSPASKKLVNLLINSTHAPFCTNNSIEVYFDGTEAFEVLLSDIANAQHHIHLEYYIVRDDSTGQRLKEALIARARAGVAVRFIYDAVGSWKLSKRFLRDLRLAGVDCKPFLPVVLPFFSRQINYRDHRKLTAIDGAVAYLGGMNIGDEYLGLNKKVGYWRDTCMRIVGETVESIEGYFLIDWAFVSGEELNVDHYIKDVFTESETVMQTMASGPDTDWEAMLQAYFLIISNAQRRVWITTPYLVPSESVLEALKTAALSGVDVRIILPAKLDHFFVFWASRANFKMLIDAGVKIYLYENGFIHAKSIVVDDDISTIGTANLDIRSLEINFEINSFIYDESIVNQLEAQYLKDIAASTEITADLHRGRPWYHIVLESVGRLVSPLL